MTKKNCLLQNFLCPGLVIAENSGGNCGLCWFSGMRVSLDLLSFLFLFLLFISFPLFYLFSSYLFLFLVFGFYLIPNNNKLLLRSLSCEEFIFHSLFLCSHSFAWGLFVQDEIPKEKSIFTPHHQENCGYNSTLIFPLFLIHFGW